MSVNEDVSTWQDDVFCLHSLRNTSSTSSSARPLTTRSFSPVALLSFCWNSSWSLLIFLMEISEDFMKAENRHL